MASKRAEPKRCDWCLGSPLYTDYHDREWGVPLRDDRLLFELLILEGAQAGLSWATILRRRASYRAAFDNFDAAKIARYGAAERKQLLADPGIIRNRLKVEAAVASARALLEVQEEHGSFSAYLWQFVGNAPIVNRWESLKDLPAATPESKALSRDLKRRGFRFVGPTICYAFMQAVGMVNDHLLSCFRHPENSAGAGRRGRSAKVSTTTRGSRHQPRGGKRR
ncbi:MAG: DNA-3-methyladenine glycosylase I [Acidimicrobiia bacterium]|nr:DNA-3-methyladenine glycosylase I [Acidimicrobiia bacterium]